MPAAIEQEPPAGGAQVGGERPVGRHGPPGQRRNVFAQVPSQTT